jgi:hypothetical protein
MFLNYFLFSYRVKYECLSPPPSKTNPGYGTGINGHRVVVTCMCDVNYRTSEIFDIVTVYLYYDILL